MSLFEILSWLSVGASVALLATLTVCARHLFVKPSVIMCALFLLQLQLPSAVDAVNIENQLPSPYDYFVFVQLLPICVLSVSLLTFRQDAKEIYRRCRETVLRVPKVFSIDLAPLICFSLAVTVWYLITVPWSTTGLYAILSQDPNANVAREYSMKLIDNRALQYAFALMTSTANPIIAVAFGLCMKRAVDNREFFQATGWLVALLAIIGSISLYGARAPSAILIGSIFFAVALRARVFLPMRQVILCIVVALLIPTFLTLFREASTVTLSQFFKYFGNVLDRSFGRTIIDGILHAHYVQTVGYFGFAGDPVLSKFFGGETVNVFNVVGLAYSPGGIQSISANTCYSVAYYACYGWWAFIPSLLLGCGLDCVILIEKRLSGFWLIACVATLAGAATTFTSTFYTTGLLTFGFAVIPAVCMIMAAVARRSTHVILLPPACKPDRRLNARAIRWRHA